MKKLFYFLVLIGLFFNSYYTSLAFTCDQVFDGGMVRYDVGYNFSDTWYNDTNVITTIKERKIRFVDAGSSQELMDSTYLDPGSEWQWTDEIVAAKGIIQPNSSMKIIETGTTDWRIQKHPIIRTNGTRNSYDFGIKYNVGYLSGSSTTRNSHTECIYYSVSWCGDGVRDEGDEICDPKDPNKKGWGNGGCNDTCEPVNVPQEPKCDSLKASATFGLAKFSTNLTCSGTNVDSYKITCGNGQVINARTGTCTYTSGGTYTPKCIVNDNVTSPTCKTKITVQSPTPAIQVEKYSGNDADLDGNKSHTPNDDTQTVKKGNEAVFTIKVTNAGNEDLTNVVLTDPLAPACNRTAAQTAPLIKARGNKDAVFNVGETFTYTCKKANTQKNYTNVVNVSGKGKITGKTVTDSDSTEVKTIEPKIQVIKVDANPQDLDNNVGNDTQTVYKNDTAIFDIIVKNIGTEDLQNIVLTDDVLADERDAPLCDKTAAQTKAMIIKQTGNTQGILKVGKSFTYTCERPNTEKDYTNKITVNGKGTTSKTPVTDDDTSKVVKTDETTCDSLTAKQGSTKREFTFTCTGTEVDSYKIQLRDEDGNLIKTFSDNTATFSFDTLGKKTATCYVNDSITSDACKKTVAPKIYDLALKKVLKEDKTYKVGDIITFDITVYNQGNVTAKDIEITDYIPEELSLDSTDTWAENTDKTMATHIIDGIAAGKSKTVEVRFKIEKAPTSANGLITNWAEISADNGDDCDSTPDDIKDNDGDVIDNKTGNGCGDGDDEDDHDPGFVKVIEDVYDLALIKTVKTQGTLKKGDNVTFAITVYNQGTIDAKDIEVTDYIPAQLKLNDDAWEMKGEDKAVLKEKLAIPANSKKEVTITFSIESVPNTGKIVNWAEISADDGDDCDSTPDQEKDNDTYTTDNYIGEGDGNNCNNGGDEDDHDPAEITVIEEPVYDLALKKTLKTAGIHQKGDTVEFTITVYNQGTIDANDIEITDYVPAELKLKDTAWEMKGEDKAVLKEKLSIPAKDTKTVTIAFEIQSIPSSRKIVNWAEISADDGDDCDSTPDSIKDNDGNVVDNKTGSECGDGDDEDDHDPAEVTVKEPGGSGSTDQCYELTPETTGPIRASSHEEEYTCKGSNKRIAIICNPDGDTDEEKQIKRTENATLKNGKFEFTATCKFERGSERTKTFKPKCQVDNASAGPRTCEAKITLKRRSGGGGGGGGSTPSNPSNPGTPSTPTYCGDGKVQRPNGHDEKEECDFRTNRPSWCTADCKIDIQTFPGETILEFGPNTHQIIGMNSDIFEVYNDEISVEFKPEHTNKTDIYLGKLCITKYNTSPDIKAGSNTNYQNKAYCKTINSDGILRKGQRFATSVPSNVFSTLSTIPSGKSYRDNTLKVTLLKDGTMYGNTYLSSDYKLRVAKPSVVTTGGGTSYVKNTNITDTSKVVDGVSQKAKVDANGDTTYVLDTAKNNKMKAENKNFSSVSVSDTLSGTTTNVTDDKSESTSNAYKNTVGKTTTVANDNPDVDYAGATRELYRGVKGAYRVKAKDIKIDNAFVNKLKDLKSPTTFVVEDGNIEIATNIIDLPQNVAFVTKNGDIKITNKDVTKITGTFIAVKGKITSVPSSKQLVVDGSLYGNINDLSKNRTYLKQNANGQLDVGTIVSFGSSVFRKPAPLTSSFINEYLDATKVAK